MEPVVRALKKKSDIDNPYAVAWSMYGNGESNPNHAKKSGLFTTPKAAGSGKSKSGGKAKTPKAKAPGAAPRKKKAKASQGQGAFSALLRGNEDTKIFKCAVRESLNLISATPADKTATDPGLWEGPKVRVVLISEGLGNKRDMNYYGPEAIASAPAQFEGAHCFLNHPSYSEERDIPERRVEGLCGYFK